MYDTILFDLDGTLVNSQKGIELSLNVAFKKYGIVYDGDITAFIGPPFVESFPSLLKTDKKLTELLIKEYRIVYAEQGVYQTTLFRGITDLLKTIKNEGKQIVLATTKPKCFAQIILKQKHIFKYFDFVSGTTLDGKLVDKVDVLKNAFDANELFASNAVLIGDTIYDALGAKDVGIDFIGVTYGYGKKEELIANGARAIANNPKELKKYLLAK